MIKNFSVSSPIHRSLELTLYLIRAEVFIENVMEEFVGDGMIGLRF